MAHHETYMMHARQAYGERYAAAVKRFQDGFLKDRVCKDLDAAFERAVETTEKLVPALKLTVAS
jgi:hypothetical protein